MLVLLERRAVYRDDAAHAFLDIFSHRMTTLFYEAWQNTSSISSTSAMAPGFDGYLLNLAGFGPRAQN
jgi:type VI secretion system protein ImpH